MSRILGFRILGRIALGALSISMIVVACQDETKNGDDDGSGASGASTTTTTNVGGAGGGTGAGGPGAGGGGNNGETICDDGNDNDNDTFTDCDDFDCCQDAACLTSDACTDPTENTDALCSDGMDNDFDDLTDCADDSCHGHPNVTVCNEAMGDFATVCSDGLDNDNDGFIDCADRDCLRAAEANNTAGMTGICWNDGTDGIEAGDLECGDNADNEDANTFVDCSDFSCQDSLDACREFPNNCADGIDNNSHSTSAVFGQFIDCDAGSGANGGGDNDCVYNGVCTTQQESNNADCSDGMDNDGDTFIDCADFSCRNTLTVTVCQGTSVTCADGLDNEASGFIDCADFDCRCCPGEGDACGMNDRVKSTCLPCSM